MLFEAFKNLRETRPHAPAFLVTSGDRALPISWRQFTDDIAVVSWLIDQRAPRGVVGVIGENSYEWITAHAAGLFCGVTVVPLEVTLSPAEMSAISARKNSFEPSRTNVTDFSTPPSGSPSRT